MKNISRGILWPLLPLCSSLGFQGVGGLGEKCEGQHFGKSWQVLGQANQIMASEELGYRKLFGKDFLSAYYVSRTVQAQEKQEQIIANRGARTPAGQTAAQRAEDAAKVVRNTRR